LQVSVSSTDIHQYYANTIWRNRSHSFLPNNITSQTSNDLTLSDDMRSKIRELVTTARRNIRLLNITDAALKKTEGSLERMNALALKATDETLTDADRLVLQEEINFLRAEIDRKAYETNEKIREKLGLPHVRGHFDPIAGNDVGAVTVGEHQDEFNRSRFVYEKSSDEEFQEYVDALYMMAKKHKSQLEYDTADTVAEIWNALQLMRPGNLGVDKLDVTTLEKAQTSLEKVSNAKAMVTRERTLIQYQTKKWYDQLKSCGGMAYSPDDPASQSSFEYMADLDITG